jgi:hypothetical protein
VADVLVARPGFRDLKVRYVDMADTTWAEKVVVVNPDGTNVGGGGGGGNVTKATAAAPVYVEGATVPLSVDLAGTLRTTAGSPDVTDRAGRLVGIVYGDVGQLAQRAVSRDALVQLRTGAVEYDARSVRALTSADQITALGLGVANAGNSSTAALGIGATFTGAGVDVRDYAAVVVTFISDQAAAFNGIQLQWSPDNANWDVVDSFNMLFTGQGQSLVSPVRGRFFRVVYTNGGTAQGYFRLNTVLKYASEVYTTESYLLGSGGKRAVVDAFGDGIGAQNRLMTDALLRAQRTDTGNQDVVRMTGNQNLKTETFVGAAAIDPRSIRALTSADVVDVSDRAARQVGVVSGTGNFFVSATSQLVGAFFPVRLTDGAAFYDGRDVSDRAARLVGVVYGSQGQQLKQTAVNFNQQVEVFVGGSAVDPRSIRALTTADAVNVGQWLGSAAPTVGQKTMANSLPVTLASDQSVLPAVSERRAATLHVTATAAVNTASTATLPAAGAGLFHYITHIELVKLYSVIGVAAGAGVIVTSTNLPGNPSWTTEQLASPAGTATKVIVYSPATPLKSSVANTATTLVAPLQLQTIWRWNISYFTGV